MIAALVLIIISRIGDGLDGSVARASPRPISAAISISRWTSSSMAPIPLGLCL
jgi:hypothetical protein